MGVGKAAPTASGTRRLGFKQGASGQFSPAPDDGAPLRCLRGIQPVRLIHVTDALCTIRSVPTACPRARTAHAMIHSPSLREFQRAPRATACVTETPRSHHHNQAGILTASGKARVLAADRPIVDLPLHSGAGGKRRRRRSGGAICGTQAARENFRAKNARRTRGARHRSRQVTADTGHSRLDVEIDDGDRQVRNGKRRLAVLGYARTRDRKRR